MATKTIETIREGKYAPWMAERTSVPPLTLSLSPWERGRLLNGCGRTPSPMGRGLG